MMIDNMTKLAFKFERIGKLTSNATADDFSAVISGYYTNTEATTDFVMALRAIAETNKVQEDMTDPKKAQIYELLAEQAEVIASCIPALELIDQKIELLY